MDLSLEDTSLEDFLSTLCNDIMNDNIQNSFNCYKYEKLNNKNALYNAIANYRDNGTIFYSKITTNHPEIKIKRIEVNRMGEHVDFIGRLATRNGSYYLQFTVYYEKTTL